MIGRCKETASPQEFIRFLNAVERAGLGKVSTPSSTTMPPTKAQRPQMARRSSALDIPFHLDLGLVALTPSRASSRPIHAAKSDAEPSTPSTICRTRSRMLGIDAYNSDCQPFGSMDRLAKRSSEKLAVFPCLLVRVGAVTQSPSLPDPWPQKGFLARSVRTAGRVPLQIAPDRGVTRPPLAQRAPFASMRVGSLLPSGCPASIVGWIADENAVAHSCEQNLIFLPVSAFPHSQHISGTGSSVNPPRPRICR